MNQDNLDTHWLNDKQNMVYPIQWNIIQQLKDMKEWYMLQHGWTLNYAEWKKPRSVWSHWFEMYRIRKYREKVDTA